MQLKSETMITQNPIIGKARKKLGGIYARTLYGKNVLQACPPPNKCRETQAEKELRASFGIISRLANQLSPSLLNYIFYAAPSGRNRRQEWTKEIAKGRIKVDGQWNFDPGQITRLGTNPKVSEQPLVITVTGKRVEIPFSSFSSFGNAILTEPPCIILIDVEDVICISLLDYTTIEDDKIILQNLSSTLLQKECWLFPLWKVNVGTVANPIYAYGSFQKS